jgi:excisionase family DNA binding protein
LVSRKKKGKFGGGQQPRIHPQVTATNDRLLRCPYCDGVFPALIEQPHAYTAREAAQFLRISYPTLNRIIDRGLLRPSRGTRHLIFSYEELSRYLKDTMQS